MCFLHRLIHTICYLLEESSITIITEKIMNWNKGESAMYMNLKIGINENDIEAVKATRIMAEEKYLALEKNLPGNPDECDYLYWLSLYMLMSKLEFLIYKDEIGMCNGSGFSKKKQLKEATVYNTGVFTEGKPYTSEKMVNHMGSKVLVSDPKDGMVDIYSMEGKFLEKAALAKSPSSLSTKKKRELDDLQDFIKENGLYSSSMYSQYWIDKFTETYGYTPGQP